jgi:hypothetical protein
MKRIILSFCLVSLLCGVRPGADDSTPLIELTPLVIDGLGPEEARFITALIQSYVADIGEVAPRDDPSPTIAGDPALAGVPAVAEVSAATEGPEETGSTGAQGAERKPDFILSGSITVDQDSRILALKVVRADTGEAVYHTSTHRTTTDLTLKVRSLVEAVFSTGLNGAFNGEDRREPMTEGAILGTWRGDAGVEIVRLQRGGVGIAILSSGAQMNLAYRIENNTLRIFQISENTERFYHPMPYTIARELSIRAEPWQYELFLYEGGSALRGVKIFTDVVYNDTRIVELIPGAVREAEWTKTSR